MIARIDSKPALAIGALAAASATLSFGFACALPLAAFATFAAMTFNRRNAVVAMLAAWFANQIVGFGCMNYPLDASTFGWGVALALVGLASLAGAGAILSRARGGAGAAIAFVAAFAIYEGSVIGLCAATGLDLSAFDAANVSRIFAINAVTFGALAAARAVMARAGGARVSAPAAA